MTKRWVLGWALLTTLLVGGPAWADAGHGDHDPAPAASVSNEEAVLTVSAHSETYELLVKYSAPEAGKTQELKLLLADYETNHPVEGAELSVELSGPGAVIIEAKPTSEKGIYAAEVTWPAAGEYSAIVSVSQGENADLLSLDGFKVTSATAGPIGRPSGWLLGGGVLLLLLGGGMAFGWARKQRLARTAATTAIAFSLVTGQGAWAHSGHDHEETGAEPIAVGAPIMLAKESQFLLGITTRLAQERTVSETATLLGKLTSPPQNVANLHAPQPGRIVSQAIATVGDRVRKGQTLAVVEQVLSTSEQIQLASDRLRLQAERTQLETSVAQAERDVAKARADIQRLRRIQDLVAGKQILEAEVTLQKAEDALKGLKKQRNEYQRLAPPQVSQVRTFPIVAPFDGTVAQAHTTYGEQVDPSKLLFQVVNPKALWMEADLFERDLTKLKQTKSGTVTVDAFPESRFSAKLLSLGTSLDEQTRTLKARFAVDNSAGRLKAGMFARIAIGLGESSKVLAVPASAVTEFSGKSVVFVLTAPESFVAREVTPGRNDGGWVAITGIQAGERVVTQGVYQLKSTAEKGGKR